MGTFRQGLVLSLSLSLSQGTWPRRHAASPPRLWPPGLESPLPSGRGGHLTALSLPPPPVRLMDSPALRALGDAGESKARGRGGKRGGERRPITRPTALRRRTPGRTPRGVPPAPSLSPPLRGSERAAAAQARAATYLPPPPPPRALAALPYLSREHKLQPGSPAPPGGRIALAR